MPTSVMPQGLEHPERQEGADGATRSLVPGKHGWPPMPSGAACSAAKPPRGGGASWLSAWPLERPRHWLKLVNTAQTEAELAALRRAVQRGCPFGEASWSEKMVRRLGLEM